MTDAAKKLRKSRILVTAFLAGSVALCAGLTFYIVPRVEHLRVDAGETIPRWKIVAVPAGDRLALAFEGQTNVFQLAGVRCPAAGTDAPVSAVARRLGLSEQETIARGVIARKTAQAWLYRRIARIERIDDTASPPIALIFVGGIDVGRKMLQHGQAYTTDLDHPHRESYLKLEARAKKEQIGLWRAE